MVSSMHKPAQTGALSCFSAKNQRCASAFGLEQAEKIMRIVISQRAGYFGHGLRGGGQKGLGLRQLDLNGILTRRHFDILPEQMTEMALAQPGGPGHVMQGQVLSRGLMNYVHHMAQPTGIILAGSRPEWQTICQGSF